MIVDYVHYMIEPTRKYIEGKMINFNVYIFISQMFLEIAGLMNIAKWVYFILVSKVHLDIRR